MNLKTKYISFISEISPNLNDSGNKTTLNDAARRLPIFSLQARQSPDDELPSKGHCLE